MKESKFHLLEIDNKNVIKTQTKKLIKNKKIRNASDVSKILKMNALLDHRGPDDNGFINHKNLLLGHTRLSIIDISNLGAQPMSVDGRYWI